MNAHSKQTLSTWSTCKAAHRQKQEAGEMREGRLRGDISAVATRVSLNHLPHEGQH